MKTIITLNYSHTKNPQHFNVMDFMKAAIVLYNLQDSKYAKFVTKFFAAFEAEDIAYQKYDSAYSLSQNRLKRMEQKC